MSQGNMEVVQRLIAALSERDAESYVARPASAEHTVVWKRIRESHREAERTGGETLHQRQTMRRNHDLTPTAIAAVRERRSNVAKIRARPWKFDLTTD